MKAVFLDSSLGNNLYNKYYHFINVSYGMDCTKAEYEIYQLLQVNLNCFSVIL